MTTAVAVGALELVTGYKAKTKREKLKLVDSLVAANHKQIEGYYR